MVAPFKGDGSEASQLPDAQGTLPDLRVVPHCTGMELVWNGDLQVTCPVVTLILFFISNVYEWYD